MSVQIRCPPVTFSLLVVLGKTLENGPPIIPKPDDSAFASALAPPHETTVLAEDVQVACIFLSDTIVRWYDARLALLVRPEP